MSACGLQSREHVADDLICPKISRPGEVELVDLRVRGGGKAARALAGLSISGISMRALGEAGARNVGWPLTPRLLCMLR